VSFLDGRKGGDYEPWMDEPNSDFEVVSQWTGISLAVAGIAALLLAVLFIAFVFWRFGKFGS
jgi:hypothetical protein